MWQVQVNSTNTVMKNYFDVDEQRPVAYTSLKIEVVSYCLHHVNVHTGHAKDPKKVVIQTEVAQKMVVSVLNRNPTVHMPAYFLQAVSKVSMASRLAN